MDKIIERKVMSDIAKDFSVIVDNAPWDPTMRNTYREANVPSVSGGYRSQERRLKEFPLICAFRNRMKETILRLEAAREVR